MMAALVWLPVGLILAGDAGAHHCRHGSFSAAAVVILLLSQSVIPALGGPLLGVAVGRRVRFRGAGLLLMIGVVVWVLVGYQLTVNAPDATFSNIVR